jgi:hypothetical protein
MISRRRSKGRASVTPRSRSRWCGMTMLQPSIGAGHAHGTRRFFDFYLGSARIASKEATFRYLAAARTAQEHLSPSQPRRCPLAGVRGSSRRRAHPASGRSRWGVARAFHVGRLPGRARQHRRPGAAARTLQYRPDPAQPAKFPTMRLANFHMDIGVRLPEAPLLKTWACVMV